MSIFFNRFENTNWMTCARQNILFTFDFCIFDFYICDFCTFDFYTLNACVLKSSRLISTFSKKKKRMMRINLMCIVKLSFALSMIIAQMRFLILCNFRISWKIKINFIFVCNLLTCSNVKNISWSSNVSVSSPQFVTSDVVSVNTSVLESMMNDDWIAS